MPGRQNWRNKPLGKHVWRDGCRQSIVERGEIAHPAAKHDGFGIEKVDDMGEFKRARRDIARLLTERRARQIKSAGAKKK